MALSRNYVADLNDPGTRSRWERSTQRSGQDPTKNPYYRAATGGPAVEPIKTGVATSDPYYGGMAQAKPLMASDSLAKPAQVAPEPITSGKPDQSGAQMLPEPTGMTVPSAPMPQPGDAGWNDISRYQRTSSGGHSNMPGMSPPGGSGIYNAASGLVPGGAGPISRGVHRMADNGVGAALTRGILGGQSANNQRYAQTARAQRQSDAQGNQLRELMANGRTMEQALAETGLKGNAEWDESARVARPRATPRQMAGGGDRYGRYQP